MLRSTNCSPLAGKVTSHSTYYLPGISVPGRLNQGSEGRTHPLPQKRLTKEES